MSIERIRTLIVGGGISGLCAALALGGDCLVLEQADEPGGWCRSIRDGGFVWDCAGHLFHFRTEAGRRFFLSLFRPEELIETRKRCRIFYHGAQIDAPFQAHLAQLEKEELIDCLCDLFQRPGPSPRGSFLDSLYSGCGAAITDKFLRPYNEKLYACDLDTLDAGAMGRFFPAMTPEEIVASLRQPREADYNSRFYYPREGAGALIDKLVRRLPAGCVRTGRRLCRVEADKRIAVDSLGRRYRYDTLINTAPLKRFLPLLGTEEARFLAGSLSANRVLALNFGFAEPSPPDAPHWLYVPGAEARFYRVGYYDALTGGDRASLYAELSFPETAGIDVAREQEDALRALRRLGLVGTDNPLLAQSAVLMDSAYVHLRPGTEARVRSIREDLAAAGIHSIGRYGGWRYCSMEDCMLEALALGEKLRAGGAA